MAKNIDAGDFRVDLNDRFLTLQQTIFLTIKPYLDLKRNQ